MGDINELMIKISIWTLPVLLSVTLHELGHAWAANRLGDPTARMLGRVSLNPIRHIDPVGTILVPLVLAYAAILHAYAVKVGFAWDLPKGRLGWLTLSFGIVVALTVLLVYPTRASGGPLVAMFWRAWPWLMLAPLGLLLAAIGVRTEFAVELLLEALKSVE